MFCKKLQSNTGNALLITMLVVVVISAIGLSVSRLTLSQVRQTSQLEDSVTAYYAAESGIEQGLLMWRYNRDVEVPANIEGGMSEQDQNAMRVDLDLMTVTYPTNILTEIPQDRKKSYYDLRVWYKNPIVASNSEEVVCSDTSTSEMCTNPDRPIVDTGALPALEKDQAIEYNVEGLSDVTLKWDFVTDYGAAGCDTCRLEVTQINEDGDDVFKKFYDYSQRSGRFIDFSNENIRLLRLRVFGDSLKEYNLSVDSPNKMSSRYSTIESLGYYGNAKRKLQIKIDRATGSILGPYDFLLFQGQ